MTLDPDLLDILVCPESRQPVAMAAADVLARLNAAIDSGDTVNRGGDPVTEPVTDGLLREDGQVLYPIRDGIPIMLIDESIEVSGPVERG